MSIDTREITLNRSIGELLARQSSMNEHMERLEERIEHMEEHIRGMENMLGEMRHLQRVLKWVLTIFTTVAGAALTAVAVSFLSL